MYAINTILAVLALSAPILAAPVDKRDAQLAPPPAYKIKTTSIAVASSTADSSTIVEATPLAEASPTSDEASAPTTVPAAVEDPATSLTTDAASIADAATSTAVVAPLSTSSLLKLVPPPAMGGPYHLKSLTQTSVSVSAPTEVPTSALPSATTEATKLPAMPTTAVQQQQQQQQQQPTTLATVAVANSAVPVAVVASSAGASSSSSAAAPPAQTQTAGLSNAVVNLVNSLPATLHSLLGL
ncbi:uncharacterized protein BKCO1_25000141 [Diplodia corticola]|uniref:Uncharacterized protein n=1 Tax=Diplodia corticola TaxID=236234 RepID=A0A1J9R0F9_9PEZI|nr:uncharacterized protein BKCO1_25000141 [Diplodia corticola]OJD34081.1 hypothetical protein BKCO1_25000141 [Diplodia corticola]